jgi:glucose/mannose-6-phosphate isomerase
VIASSHSGNTEETVACFEEALKRGCQVAAIATGGKIQAIANEHHVMFGGMPHDTQPRMGMIYNLRVLLKILVEYGLVKRSVYDEVAATHDWLAKESDAWVKEMPIERNYAKQLALIAVGKTPVFYGGSLMAPVAYKWKISWNENAKNVSFWNFYPEFNHNEFIGWTSHPVEKPFVIFDLVSDLEHPRILRRFELSDKLLSGRRPKANVIPMGGDTVLKQMLWGCILADFVSIYVAILNNVDPTPVDLIEKFKTELG